MKHTKFLAGLLAMVLLTSVLTACGESGPSVEEELKAKTDEFMTMLKTTDMDELLSEMIKDADDKNDGNEFLAGTEEAGYEALLTYFGQCNEKLSYEIKSVDTNALSVNLDATYIDSIAFTENFLTGLLVYAFQSAFSENDTEAEAEFLSQLVEEARASVTDEKFKTTNITLNFAETDGNYELSGNDDEVLLDLCTAGFYSAINSFGEELDNAFSEDSSDAKGEGSGDVMEASDFSELTVSDDENLSVTITGVSCGDECLSLKLALENKSDKELMFSVENCSVNGWVCDSYWAESVKAGCKDNETVDFYLSDIIAEGVTTVNDVTLIFYAYDNNDWGADRLLEKELTIYPFGADNKVKEMRIQKDTDQVIYENDQVTVLLTDIDADSMWGYSLMLYIYNKTDKNLMVSLNDVSVNGSMCDPFFAKSVYGECQAMAELSFSKDSLAEEGIENIEEIAGILSVYDEDDWMADHLLDEEVIIRP